MTAFDKAWSIVKEEDDTKLQDALEEETIGTSRICSHG